MTIFDALTMIGGLCLVPVRDERDGRRSGTAGRKRSQGAARQADEQQDQGLSDGNGRDGRHPKLLGDDRDGGGLCQLEADDASASTA